MSDTGGNRHQEIPDTASDGIILLDGWLTKLELVVGIDVVPTAGSSIVMGFGIKLNPHVEAEFNITNSYNFDDVFEGFTAGTTEALALFGAVENMPLFYLMIPASEVVVEDKVILTKYFRRAVHANDQLIFYYNKRNLTATADNTSTGSDISLNGSFEQVIAPRKWN
jgi:hypothetical protein